MKFKGPAVEESEEKRIKESGMKENATKNKLCKLFYVLCKWPRKR